VRTRILGIVFLSIGLAANAQQNEPSQPEQQQSTASDPQAAAPQEGGDPAQQPQNPGLRRAPSTPNWNHNHEVYPNTVQQNDPGDPDIYQRNGDCSRRGSAVDKVTHAINPNDTNYGGLLSQWHQQLVHDLLLSAEFWCLMISFVAIITLLLYILWLLRQRDQRLRITVDIVHQLTNSRNFARFHNLRVIKIHNDLVERLNDQFERELREGGDNQRPIESATLPGVSVVPPTGSTDGGAREAESDVNEIGSAEQPSRIPSVAAANEFGIEGGTSFRPLGLVRKPILADAGENQPEQSDAEIALARANAAAATPSVVPQTAAQEEDLRVANRRLTAQVEALTQQRTSLRNQLNQRREATALGEIDHAGELK